LALVGSGIACCALFLPWDYRCGIIEPACVPGLQDPNPLAPIEGPYSPTNSPTAYVLSLAFLPFLGLFFALLLAFVPVWGRWLVAVISAVIGFCGLCGAPGMLVWDSLGWSDDPGTWHADWGIAVSVLGYAALLAGIAVLFRLGASPQDAAPPPDAGDLR
jgi:hypothetical protein